MLPVVLPDLVLQCLPTVSSDHILSLLRPLWLILVSPVCLPERQATNPNPLNFWISFTLSNLDMSPISASIPDRMFSPIPDIARMFFAYGISLHLWFNWFSISESCSSSSIIRLTNHLTACLPASAPSLIPTLFLAYSRIDYALA